MNLALGGIKHMGPVPHVSTLTSTKMYFICILLYVLASVSIGTCGEGKFPSDMQALVDTHCSLLAPQRNQPSLGALLHPSKDQKNSLNLSNSIKTWGGGYNQPFRLETVVLCLLLRYEPPRV